MGKTFTVRDLPKTERPREKLLKYGPSKLLNSELLAILLRTGKKGENVIEMAKRFLKRYGAQNLPNLDIKKLQEFPGIGPAKACEIIACFELGKRLLQNKIAEIYLKPTDIWEELKDLRHHKKEHFVIFYLDSRNQEIRREVISVGTLNTNLVHPREVFEPAVANLAAQIIIAHNHPSGDPEPSEDDLKITKQLIEAGKILGIEVLDHIIIAKDKYLSFKDKGLLT
jgi:DNA repair protein RadC